MVVRRAASVGFKLLEQLGMKRPGRVSVITKT